MLLVNVDIDALNLRGISAVPIIFVILVCVRMISRIAQMRCLRACQIREGRMNSNQPHAVDLS